ncbi:MAG TPA: hypothetical protein VLJ86_25715 [Ramlibacter sp.]|nr:hypothetical protein [Ramlibacter sp.]
MDILIPIWQHASAPELAAQGLRSLKGIAVAVVDDGFDKSFTSRLEALLRDAHGAIVTSFVKPIGSAPAPKAMIEAAAMSRVAVVGIGL